MLLLACLLPLAVSVQASPAVAPDKPDRLKLVLENLRAAERLYDDIELRVRKTYKAIKMEVVIPGQSKTLTVSDRFVTQQGKIYWKTDESAETMEGEKLASSNLVGFIGGEGRTVRDATVANITDAPPGEVLRSHTLILPSACIKPPLSVFLEGGDRFKHLEVYSSFETSSTYEAEEDVDGLECSRIRLEVWRKGMEGGKSRSFIWLAHDRNELPIKVVGFALGYSKTIPLEEDRVVEFLEVKPGVWFPSKIRYDVNDEISASKGKVVPSNTTELVVESVDLSPSYPDSFFQDIPIPDGAKVYVVKNKKIVKSYVQGGKGKPAEVRKGISWTTVILSGCGAVVALALAGVARRAVRARRAKLALNG